MFNTSLYNELNYNQSAIKHYADTSLKVTSNIFSEVDRIRTTKVQINGSSNINSNASRLLYSNTNLIGNSDISTEPLKVLSSNVNLTGISSVKSKPSKILISNTNLIVTSSLNSIGTKVFRPIANLTVDSSMTSIGKVMVGLASNLVSNSYLSSKQIKVIRSIELELFGVSSLLSFGIRQQANAVLARAYSNLIASYNVKFNGISNLNSSSTLESESFKYGFTNSSLLVDSTLDSKSMLIAVTRGFLSSTSNTVSIPFKLVGGRIYANAEAILNSNSRIIFKNTVSLKGIGKLSSVEPFIHKWFYQDVEEVEWITKNTPQTVWEEVEPEPTVWKKVIK